MTEAELQSLVASTFSPSDYGTARYPEGDTDRINEFFDSTFPPLFLAMRSLLRSYAIPGDHLPADEMIHDYGWECENNPNFTADFIPFYAVGNGDYLCLSRKAGASRPVIYVAHDDPTVDILHATFADYLMDADWFRHK